MNVDDVAIRGFDYFINPSMYKERKQEVFSLLTKLMGEVTSEVDTIVGVDRKGAWIMDNFFSENPGLKKFNVISDNEVISNKSLVTGLKVLVFDDSIHTATTILDTIDLIKPLDPKSIMVSCLLSNKESIRLIENRHQDIAIKSCVSPFDDYPTQSVKYLEWELLFVDGLKSKDNPDFPKIKITTPSSNLDLISKAIIKAIKGIVSIVKEIDVEKIENTIKAININIEVESDNSVVLPPYDSLAEPDEAKIRASVTQYGDKTEIIVTPLIFPRLDPDKCNMEQKPKKDCLCKIQKLRHKDEAACKLCLTTLINDKFASIAQVAIVGSLKGHSIIIESEKKETPKIGRFMR